MKKIKELKSRLRALDAKESLLIKNNSKVELKNLRKEMSNLSLLLESYTEQMSW